MVAFLSEEPGIDRKVVAGIDSLVRVDLAQHGIRPKVESLFRNVERGGLSKYQPVLEVVARRCPPSWRHMVSLYEWSPTADDSLAKAKRAIEQYLQLPGRLGDDQDGCLEEAGRAAWED